MNDPLATPFIQRDHIKRPIGSALKRKLDFNAMLSPSGDRATTATTFVAPLSTAVTSLATPKISRKSAAKVLRFDSSDDADDDDVVFVGMTSKAPQHGSRTAGNQFVAAQPAAVPRGPLMPLPMNVQPSVSTFPQQQCLGTDDIDASKLQPMQKKRRVMEQPPAQQPNRSTTSVPELGNELSTDQTMIMQDERPVRGPMKLHVKPASDMVIDSMSSQDSIAELLIGAEDSLCFESISAALEQAQPFDTILVHPGVYNERPLCIDKPGIRLINIRAVKAYKKDQPFDLQDIVENDTVLIKGSRLRAPLLTIAAPLVQVSYLTFQTEESPKVPAVSIQATGKDYSDLVPRSYESGHEQAHSTSRSHKRKLELEHSIRLHHCSISSQNCAILIDKGPAQQQERSYTVCVQQNRIFQTDKTGIYCKKHFKGVISHNTVEQCGCSGILVCMEGKYGDKKSQIPLITLCISDNVIKNCKQSGIWIKGGEKSDELPIPEAYDDGESAPAQSKQPECGYKLMVQKNRVHHNGFPNIVVSENSYPIIYKNELFGSMQNGICFRDFCRPNAQHNKVYDNTYPNVYVQDNAEVFMKLNEIRACKAGGIWCKGRSRLTLRDCSIIDNGFHGVLCEGECRISMEQCKILRNEKIGISFRNQAKGIVRDCEVAHQGSANIACHDQSRPTISRSQLHHAKEAGLIIADQCFAEVICNQIFENEHSNICLFGQSAGEINDCEIYSSKQNGIFLRDETQFKICNNHIFRNAFVNVKITGHSRPHILSNRIHEAGESGVWARDYTISIIKNNDIFDNHRENILVDLLTAEAIMENNSAVDSRLSLLCSQATQQMTQAIPCSFSLDI